MNKIAIIGATSHIAKGLIHSFFNNTDDLIYLFARNTGRVNYFIENQKLQPDRLIVLSFKEFIDFQYSVIINCVGISDPGKQKDAGSSIFFITETFDNMILDYLKINKNTLYINFSSGAVYGTSFAEPVDYPSSSEICVNNISEKDYYRIAKLYSEAKHRSLKEYNIIDLRVFSYFSRFIDLESSFLMTDILRSIINKKELITNETDIVRDYIDPADLFELIQLISANPFNGVLDCYSAAPVRKFEILDAFKKEFGLHYIVNKSSNVIQATGNKNIYYSQNHKSEELGFKPKKNSLECLLAETKNLV